MSGLQNILSKLPLGGGGGNDHAQQAEDIKAKYFDIPERGSSHGGHFLEQGFTVSCPDPCQRCVIEC